jgi:hypothetical protein
MNHHTPTERAAILAQAAQNAAELMQIMFFGALFIIAFWTLIWACKTYRIHQPARDAFDAMAERQRATKRAAYLSRNPMLRMTNGGTQR